MSNPVPYTDPYDLFESWLVAHGWPSIEDMDAEDVLNAAAAYGRYDWSMEPTLPGLEVEYASYGETPKKCRAARKIADDVWDEVVAAYEVRA